MKKNISNNRIIITCFIIFTLFILSIFGCSNRNNKVYLYNTHEFLNGNKKTYSEITSYIINDSINHYFEGSDAKNISSRIKLDECVITLEQANQSVLTTDIYVRLYLIIEDTLFYQNINITEKNYSVTSEKIGKFSEHPQKDKINEQVSLENFMLKIDNLNINSFIEKLKYGDRYTLQYAFTSKYFKNTSNTSNVFICRSDSVERIRINDEITLNEGTPFVYFSSLNKMTTNTYKANEEDQILLICLSN